MSEGSLQGLEARTLNELLKKYTHLPYGGRMRIGLTLHQAPRAVRVLSRELDSREIPVAT